MNLSKLTIAGVHFLLHVNIGNIPYIKILHIAIPHANMFVIYLTL